jgi:hypothetical protein
MKRRIDIYEKKELILEWVKEGKAKAYICRDLKCKPETLNGFLKEWGIDYKGNQSHKGEENKKCYKPASFFLGTDKQISSYKLIYKLFRDGLKERKCECCGLTEWLGKEIPLELHHINGDHFDNHLENLKVLCPNCHAFTDNYSGRASNNK